MKGHFDGLSRVAVGFLGSGAVITIFCAFQMGPEANITTALMGVALAVGFLSLLISLVLYIIAVSLRETSWSEVGTLTLIGASLIGGSLLWLVPVKDVPVVFHPAVATELLGIMWLIFAVFCAFRHANAR